MLLGLFHYQILADILKNIHSHTESTALAQFVLKKVSQTMNSEGGTMFLIEDDNELKPMAAYGAPLDVLRQQKFEMGKGVVGWVAQFKESVRVDDVRLDSRFNPNIDLKSGFNTRSLIASPILFGDKVVGVLEFVNKKHGDFNDADLGLITLLGQELGSAFEKIQLKQLLAKTQNLERAVSNLTAGVLIADPHETILLANERARALLQTEKFNVEEGEKLKDLEAHWPMLARSLKEVIDSAKPQNRQSTSIEQSGRVKCLGYSCVPLTDAEGTVAGAALLFQDITSASWSQN